LTARLTADLAAGFSSNLIFCTGLVTFAGLATASGLGAFSLFGGGGLGDVDFEGGGAQD
jgi:hypothetical protein